MGIVSELLALFDSTIVVQPGTLDGSGAWLASGSNTSYPARYEFGARIVRDWTGQEVTSSVFAIVAGVLTTHDPSVLRFTIPAATFLPYSELQALRIDPVSDESGPICCEVYF